jgi:hypothetical protein
LKNVKLSLSYKKSVNSFSEFSGESQISVKNIKFKSVLIWKCLYVNKVEDINAEGVIQFSFQFHFSEGSFQKQKMGHNMTT